MLNTRLLRATFLTLAFTVSLATAQHIQGEATFPTTPNGPQTLEFTLNNADTADSGVGTVDKVNGQTTNIAITWSRDDAGRITAYIAGIPQFQLDGATKELPQGEERDALLNDGTPPSGGKWERKNSP